MSKIEDGARRVTGPGGASPRAPFCPAGGRDPRAALARRMDRQLRRLDGLEPADAGYFREVRRAVALSQAAKLLVTGGAR